MNILYIYCLYTIFAPYPALPLCVSCSLAIYIVDHFFIFCIFIYITSREHVKKISFSAELSAKALTNSYTVFHIKTSLFLADGGQTPPPPPNGNFHYDCKFFFTCSLSLQLQLLWFFVFRFSQISPCWTMDKVYIDGPCDLLIWRSIDKLLVEHLFVIRKFLGQPYRIRTVPSYWSYL